jgi:ankyrin repeat protein
LASEERLSMSEQISKDISLLRDEIEKLQKFVKREQDSCFDRCKIKLENVLNELSSKKIDKYRNIAFFIFALLAFLGIPSLNYYIAKKIDETVSENFKQYENKIAEQTQVLKDKMISSIMHFEAFRNDLNSKRKKILVDMARVGDFSSVMSLMRSPEVSNVDKDDLDDDGRCVLFWATIYEKEDIVDELLRLNADLNCSNMSKDGMTPLMVALLSDNPNIANKLIEKGANLNCIDILNHTPLHYALMSPREALLTTMLLKGANPDMISNKNGDIPLIEAIKNNVDYKIVSIILENTKNVDWKNYFGETALIIAVEKSNKKIAELLIKKRADIKIAQDWAKYSDEEKAKNFLKILEKLN